ncbi:hypothetical protein B0H14DRAFT_2557368 [Mycena olivaceomarginata]|nr:hypothetical protein B0H14DRAFT_2557368 [Mycena olivaceomarginata]
MEGLGKPMEGSKKRDGGTVGSRQRVHVTYHCRMWPYKGVPGCEYRNIPWVVVSLYSLHLVNAWPMKHKYCDNHVPISKDVHEPGKATCPKCSLRRGYGTSSIINLVKTHLDKVGCTEAHPRRTSSPENGLLSAFFKAYQAAARREVEHHQTSLISVPMSLKNTVPVQAAPIDRQLLTLSGSKRGALPKEVDADRLSKDVRHPNEGVAGRSIEGCSNQPVPASSCPVGYRNTGGQLEYFPSDYIISGNSTLNHSLPSPTHHPGPLELHWNAAFELDPALEPNYHEYLRELEVFWYKKTSSIPLA